MALEGWQVWKKEAKQDFSGIPKVDDTNSESFWQHFKLYFGNTDKNCYDTIILVDKDPR